MLLIQLSLIRIYLVLVQSVKGGRLHYLSFIIDFVFTVIANAAVKCSIYFVYNAFLNIYWKYNSRVYVDI